MDSLSPLLFIKIECNIGTLPIHKLIQRDVYLSLYSVFLYTQYSVIGYQNAIRKNTDKINVGELSYKLVLQADNGSEDAVVYFSCQHGTD